MILTPAQKEAIQERLLLLANASGRRGLPQERLLHEIRSYGFPALSAEALDAELHHLEKADLLAPVEKTLRPDLRRWTTTASGDRWLMENGLI